ncbi:MAG: ABC transporter permease, partial [Bradyrhizobiaceae bacterium]|nr:ABC transporter permease [Bradyrhizobiaceae bacterium]
MAQRPLSHRIIGWGGALTVTAILGFLVLPAFVVVVAAFNDSALLSFPPQKLSLRWLINAMSYGDFQTGFRNSIVVTFAASSIALFVGSTFSFVLDRYQFRAKRVLESLLLAPLVVPHFTAGLGFLFLAAQVGASRGYGVVIACHVV